jgi:hypothetical protein
MGPKYELASSKRDACVFNLVTLAQGGEDYAKKNIETITKLLSQEETVKPA